jgi:hypothetical protein
MKVIKIHKETILMPKLYMPAYRPYYLPAYVKWKISISVLVPYPHKTIYTTEPTEVFHICYLRHTIALHYNVVKGLIGNTIFTKVQSKATTQP